MQYNTFSGSMKELKQEWEALSKEYEEKAKREKEEKANDYKKTFAFEAALWVGAQENKTYWKDKAMKFKNKVKTLWATAVVAFLLFVTSCSVAAGDFSSTCKDAYVNGNCTPRIEVTLEKEALFVQDSNGRTFWWAYQDSPSSPGGVVLGWGNTVQYLTGKFTVLDGGVTLGDLASLGVKFGTTTRLAECYQLFGPFVCAK